MAPLRPRTGPETVSASLTPLVSRRRTGTGAQPVPPRGGRARSPARTSEGGATEPVPTQVARRPARVAPAPLPRATRVSWVPLIATTPAWRSARQEALAPTRAAPTQAPAARASSGRLEQEVGRPREPSEAWRQRGAPGFGLEVGRGGPSDQSTPMHDRRSEPRQQGPRSVSLQSSLVTQPLQALSQHSPVSIGPAEQSLFSRQGTQRPESGSLSN